jgi:hypothetical protein
MKQKLLLTLVLCLSLMGSSWAQTATAPTVGDGSSTNPYQIANVNNLYWLSQNSSIWAGNYYFKQTADIDLTGISWTAIGTNAIRFSGNYDGNNNAISNLTINASTNDQGLFGSVAEGSVIQNLTISKANITTTANYAGIVASINRGQIINCHTKSGSITGVGYVGGICAIVSGTGSRIERCYNSSTVTATGQYVGGIVAQAQNATIEQCSNTSPIKSTLATIGSADIGGIVGNVPDLGCVHTSINNCYNTSSVTTTRGNSAGGIIGSGSGITMNNCYSVDGIVANSQAGGLMGLAGTRNTFSNCVALIQSAIGLNETLVTRNNVKEVSSEQLATQSTFTNWDFAGETANGTKDIWLCFLGSNGYPAFAEQLLAVSFVSENSGTLTFPIQGSGTNPYILVDWGDGTQEKKNVIPTLSLTHEYVKGNVVKIYTNDAIWNLQITNLGLTSLTLGRHKSIYQFSCDKNKLSIATLPWPRNSYTTYAPQQQLAATCTNGVVDLSKQLIAIDKNGSPQTTVYAWYLANKTALTAGTDYIESNGVFKFIKIPTSTVYCTMANAVFPNFTGANILRTTNITIDAIAPINWSGATSTDWNTASNWVEGVVPTTENNVVIPKVTNLPVISASTTANCNNIEVNADASLTIAASATQTGSLIVNGTATGNTITVQSYLTGNAWHVVAPIVGGESIVTFMQNTDNAIAYKNNNYGMTDYDVASNKWNPYFTASAGNLTSGKGYLLRRSDNGLVSYTGSLATGTQSIALNTAGEGWNCVGNPYTSAISMNTTADAYNNFITMNATTNSNIDGSYAGAYIWDPSSLSYKIVGNADWGTRKLSLNYIAPGQGFFVKAASGATAVTFTTAMQSHQNGSVTVKAAKAVWPNIQLSVASGSATATAVLAFNQQMTNGLDVTYDAGLLRGTSGLNLYSRLVEDNGVDFAIQCLPTNYSGVNIPLGVECKEGGNITFSAETTELPADASFELFDSEANIATPITDKFLYVVNVEANANLVNRFYLRSKSSSNTTSVNNVEYQTISAYANAKHIYINGAKAGSRAQLFDVNGRCVSNFKLNSATETISAEQLTDGIYILKINEKTFKVILK